jgi:hypothetical protein
MWGGFPWRAWAIRFRTWRVHRARAAGVPGLLALVGADLFVEQTVIDPDGGVLAVFGSVVSRFDGRACQELYRAGLGSVVRAVSAGPGSIAVLVGSESVVRCDANGTCATVALDSEREFQAIAAFGRDVLLLDDHVAAPLRGDVLREIWGDGPDG